MTDEQADPATGASAVDRVREALHEVIDPCTAARGSNIDIVEMGLVESVRVTDGEAHVDLRLTTPACHMVPYFLEEIEACVTPLKGIEGVEIATDDGFQWTEEMMSDNAKERRETVLAEHRARYRESAE